MAAYFNIIKIKKTHYNIIGQIMSTPNKNLTFAIDKYHKL